MGGLMMLSNSNLQFTNATRLNDPFDCHPSLMDFSNVPKSICKGWPPHVIQSLCSGRHERYRERARICSLSKIFDSLLMWSYYSNHKGICIGLDMEKVSNYLSQMHGQIVIGCWVMEVQYRNIVEKPNYYRSVEDFFRYQMSTNAMAWKHEQEVRLISWDPLPSYMRLLPHQDDREGPIDWKEIRAYLPIGGECFDSIYLGVTIDGKMKKRIVEEAKKLNPSIAIYQMKVDPDAFLLKPELIK